MKTLLSITFGFLVCTSFSQQTDTLMIRSKGATLFTIHSLPKKKTEKIAIIIAGSGPTDHNGNNPMMKNNSLLYLSEALIQNGIATIRYDKRGIGRSISDSKKEEDVRIEDMAGDVSRIIQLADSLGYKDITVIGHSEGSLLALIAIQTATVQRFISLSGVAQPADNILKEQLIKQLPDEMYKKAVICLDSLKSGNKITDYPKELVSIFRPSVQPYLISWFRYTPTDLIKKLTIPTLIIQGTSDIQVSVSEAEQLHKALSSSQLTILPNMNHVLKEVSENNKMDLSSYYNPDTPLKKELSSIIVKFINN